MTTDTDLTEEDIQKRLASDYVTGPQSFKGKELAPWTMGLRDLIFKVLKRDDTPEFHDCAALYVLTEAAGEDKLEIRKRLIRETDDVDGFRASVSVWLDGWTREDAAAARLTVGTILSLAEAAEVEPAKKKEAEPAPGPVLPATSPESGSSPG